MRPTSLSRSLAWLASGLFAVSCAAQVMQDPGTLPDGRRMPIPGARPGMPQNPTVQPVNPSGAPAPGPVPRPAAFSMAPAPAVPAATPLAPDPREAPSLLDKPAQPAKVKLAAGQLSVDADNSSLSEILHQLAASSGMTVDGITQDQRIFGDYGPGNPRDILSSLLDDAGYNVLMVGSTADGAPRQLILTQRSNAPITQSASNAPPQQDDDQDEVPLNNYPVAGELPQQRPVPPMPQQNSNGPVRTPQQMLQELQQMRERQMQQVQPNPQ